MIGIGLVVAAGMPAAAQTYDVVILNGRVIDPESGLHADRSIGIRSDRIVAISKGSLRGRDTIDARGLVVAPGFIDLHRHAHGENSWRFQVKDGVTTALELEIGTADVDAWYGMADSMPGRLVNYGVAAGHIGARMRVLGDSGFMLPSGPGKGRATVSQAQEIVQLVENGLKQGAVAVGMGLAYTPEANSMEVLQVFRTAARYGASVHVHLAGGLTSLVSVLGMAAISGAPLHIAHVNSTAGDNIGSYLQAIEGARANKLDVTTEVYPYTAGATLIQSALYDNWESFPDERFATLQWAATGERLTRATFAKYRAQGGSVISHGNSEESLLLALASPLTMVVSDGGRNERDVPTHPRAAGTFSRVLGHYARETRTLSLMEALRKMTIAPAKRLEARVPEMRDRGRIRVGAYADVVAFDSAAIIDKATYTNAAVFSEGVRYVLVNGTPVVRAGEIVPGRSPGRPIRAPVAATK
jgi:dihydroorotase